MKPGDGANGNNLDDISSSSSPPARLLQGYLSPWTKPKGETFDLEATLSGHPSRT